MSQQKMVLYYLQQAESLEEEGELICLNCELCGTDFQNQTLIEEHTKLNVHMGRH